MTPLTAIRKKCVDCVGSKYATQDCGGDQLLPPHGDENNQCYFFPYRQGKGRASIRTIRKFCLECQGGNREFVRECNITDCPLHPFRMGKNPNISPSRADHLAMRRTKFSAST